MQVPSSIDSATAFALASAFVSVAAFLPYVVGILQGRTMPCRASWFVWSVLSATAFASLVAEGATTSLAFVGIQSGGTILVFLLSLVNGRSAPLGRFDRLALGGAAAGIASWWLTADPVWALGLTIAVGSIGGLLTALKAFATPRSENLPSWMTFLTAACLAIASVREPDPVLLAYPVYLATIYAAIVLAILLGRPARAALRRGSVPRL
jgi:hypothetical protein